MADQNSSLLAHLLAKGYSLDDINSLRKPEEDQDDGFFKKASDYVANKRLDFLKKEGLLPNPPVDSRELAASNQAIGEFDKQNKTELPDYLSNSQSSDGLALGMGDSARVRAEAPKGVDYGEQFGPPAPSKGGTSPSKPKSDSDLFKMVAGGFTDDTVNALADTQKLQNQAVLANQLGKASELIGSGFSRVKPQAQEIFDSNIKQSENIVKDYLQRAKQEESDPGSTKSQFARESMRRLGIQVPENVAFDAIEKAFPKFVQMKGLEEQVAQRREAAAARAEDVKLRREEIAAAKGEKQKETNEKFTQSLRKELTAGEIGKARANYMTARKAEDALSAFAKDPTGYTDYGSLMLGLKALQGDQSVVREAEIRLGKNAASLFQKAENAIQGAMTGKSLQPEQRKAIADSVGHLSQIAKRQYQELASPIVTQAKSQGYDLNKILDKKAFPEFFSDDEKHPQSDVDSTIKSRSSEENKARLDFLKKKYGR